MYMWRYRYRFIDKVSLPSKNNVYYSPPTISPPNNVSWGLLHRIAQKDSFLLFDSPSGPATTIFSAEDA